MREKHIILAARVISALFTPFYLPLVSLLALFLFSYLSLLPLVYKLYVLTIVYLFTVLMPTLLIYLYRRFHGWSLIELGNRERRMVPYVISILNYIACLYVMDSNHIPHFMGSIVIAALFIQIVCAMINAWWKISTHTAATGGMVGALFAFGEIFGFNPVWWICLGIGIAGIVGTSRMILRQHSLSQVVMGFIVGFFLSALAILFT